VLLGIDAEVAGTARIGPGGADWAGQPPSQQPSVLVETAS
jgi:hypothetical protein